MTRIKPFYLNNNFTSSGLLQSIGMWLPFLLAIRPALDNSLGLSEIHRSMLSIPSFYGMLIGAICILFLVGESVYRRFYTDKLAKVFLLFVVFLFCWVLVAYANFGKEAFFIALKEWVRIGVIFLIYLAFLNLARYVDINKTITALLLALIVPFLAAVYQVLWGKRLFWGQKRVYGTFSHPNPFSYFLFLCMAITLWKIKVNKVKLPWIIILFTESLFLCLTWCRGAMLVAIILLLIMAISYPKELGIVCIITIVIIGLLWLSNPRGKKRLEKARLLVKAEILKDQHSPAIKKGIKKVNNSSIKWRLEQWSSLIEKWKLKPVMGYGIFTSKKFLSPFHKLPHNDYVKFLVETGLVGFLLWLTFLLVIGFKLYYFPRKSAVRDLSFTLLTVFGVWQLSALWANQWRNTAFMFLFWALSGLVVGKSENDRHNGSSDD